jgi:transcriptional regulator with XRE-family HTH domain
MELGRERIKMILMRHEIGDVLRDYRTQRGMTLRDVSGRASVALGYLSELERGQKEASSEILRSLTDALGVPLSTFLIEVGNRLALFEGLESSVSIPDTVPEDFLLESKS